MEVDFLTKESFVGILAHNPYIDTIIGHKSYTETKAILLSKKYDYVVDLHKNIRSMRIRSMLNAPSYTYHKQTLEKELFLRTGINKLTSRHLVDRYYDAVKPLGIVDDGLGMDFHLSDSAPSVMKNFPKDYIALALGATHYTKRMTPNLLEKLVSSISQPIVSLGGKDVLYLSEDLAVRYPTRIIDLVGKTSIDGSAHILSGASYVISGDSAMMHIAAALNKKILAVWGSTHPIWGYEPFYGKAPNKSIYLEKTLSCRPCTKNGEASCPKKHFDCMNYSIEEVQEAIKKIEAIS